MDYARHGEIQGRSLVFLKAHCPYISPCLTWDTIILRNYQLIITLSQSNKDSMRSSTWARTEAFQVDHTSTG